MAEGKKIEELSSEEIDEMKRKSQKEAFFGIVKTRNMTLQLKEIAAISRDEPPTRDSGGRIFIIFKSGNQQSLKYNNLDERDKDYKKIEDALSQGALIPTKNLD